MSDSAGSFGGDLTPQANWGTSSTYVTFKQRIVSNPSGSSATVEYMPRGTYVRAVDYNASLPDYILAEGFVGSIGRFSFNLRNCDTSTVFDTSALDVYFIFETRTNDKLTASHGTFARRHWWRTATYYNQSATALKNQGVITVKGANSEAVYTQHIWHKVSQVRNWERNATGVSFLPSASCSATASAFCSGTLLFHKGVVLALTELRSTAHTAYVAQLVSPIDLTHHQFALA